MIKFNAEPGIAAREAQPIDVGQDDQLEMLLEIAKRLDAVGKGRPIANRCRELCRFDGVRLDAQPLAKARMHLLEQLRIDKARLLFLDLMLDRTISVEQLLDADTALIAK